MPKLEEVDYNPFEVEGKKLIPVDGNPFEQAASQMPQVELAQAHESIPVPPQWKYNLSNFARPMLEGGGAAVGGIIGAGAGAPTGPGAIATSILGGSLGYSIGKKSADALDQALGLRGAPTLTEQTVGTINDIAKGAMYEMGGQIAMAALKPVLKAGKWTFEKTAGAIKKNFTEQGAKKAAGELLIAQTDDGLIYAKNIDQARQIEKDIPGLKFDIAQASNQSGLIKLKRALVRGEGKGVDINDEVIRSNNEAIRNYFQKSFPEKEGVDDFVGGLSNAKQSLTAAEQQAKTIAEQEALSVGVANPQQTGKNIVDVLKINKDAYKKQASELYGKVKDEGIPVATLVDDFKNIVKPMTKYEDAANIPPVLSKVIQDIEENGITSLPIDDLQGLRSELLAQSRQVKASNIPNERLSARLSQAARSIEKAIDYSDGSDALKVANKFFREDYAVKFKQGTIKDILKPGYGGEATKIPIEKIPSKLWNAKDLQSADQFIKAVGNKTATDIMRDHAAYDMFESVKNENGEIVARKLNVWLYRNKSLLKKFGIENDFKGIKAAQEAFEAAKGASAQFEKSAAQRVLNADVDKAISTALSGDSAGKNIATLMKTVEGDKAALNGLRKGVADHIMTKIRTTATDIAGDPTISNAKFSNILDKYKPVINTLYKNDPDKIKALKNMQKAYEIMNRTNRSSIGGGSDTAENMITYFSQINFLSRWASAAKSMLRFFKGRHEARMNDFVIRAMFDPDYAQVLKEAGSPKINYNQMQKVIDAKIINLQDYRSMRQAAGFAGASAAIASEE